MLAKIYDLFLGQIEMVKILVEKHLDVNATDIDGLTPLHVAVHCRDCGKGKRCTRKRHENGTVSDKYRQILYEI